MTKKFTIGLLITVVVAGLILVPFSQVVAQVPVAATQIIPCPSGDQLRLEFDSGGNLTAAFYQLYGSSTWVEITLGSGYVCNGSDGECRPIVGAELGYFCGSLGAIFGSFFGALF